MTVPHAFFKEVINMLIAISMDIFSSRTTTYLAAELRNSSGGVRIVDVFINGINGTDSKRVSAVIDDDVIDATSFVRIVQQYDEKRG